MKMPEIVRVLIASFAGYLLGLGLMVLVPCFIIFLAVSGICIFCGFSALLFWLFFDHAPKILDDALIFFFCGCGPALVGGLTTHFLIEWFKRRKTRLALMRDAAFIEG